MQRRWCINDDYLALTDKWRIYFRGAPRSTEEGDLRMSHWWRIFLHLFKWKFKVLILFFGACLDQVSWPFWSFSASKIHFLSNKNYASQGWDIKILEMSRWGIARKRLGTTDPFLLWTSGWRRLGKRYRINRYSAWRFTTIYRLTNVVAAINIFSRGWVQSLCV